MRLSFQTLHLCSFPPCRTDTTSQCDPGGPCFSSSSKKKVSHDQKQYHSKMEESSVGTRCIGEVMDRPAEQLHFESSDLSLCF
ncbi:hypothetical protein BT96DRAFT_548555 [Gymnopus androsaceus JB14]|uniref:Uncharacterized protein n=1 Tax=Gymnopus androsaceus JB14 TaxID=1447944 RepID=A0A6A4HZ92_9AGAR|nr:hypothetical protein BT96DRAFT_548555 [Gymnopus androsaceus JB14]